MEKILVTGGAGFMGSHLVDELIDSNYKVTVLDDLSGGFEDNVNKKAKFINGSIEDYELLNELFDNNKYTYVFHLAAYAAEGLSHFIRRYNYSNNLIGSVNLINLSVKHKVKCFVFTSSIAVYGQNQLPMLESTTPLPEDPYGIAKFAVELDLKSAKEMFGLNYIIFRPHNVYGERQNIGDKYRNVIGIFMNQLMQNKPLTVFGDGKQSRAFSYVKDVMPIIASSIENQESYNQIFNVGSDEVHTVIELAKIICKEFDKELNISYQDQRNEVLHAFSSHEKLFKYFGFEPKYKLSDGIKRMYQWAIMHGSKETKKFSNIDIEEKLPPIWK